MKYKLGLDMGATSIGWAVVDLDNKTLVDAGVRIFDDGREDKSKASLCVKRRNARGMRRLNNRKHIKTEELLSKLQEYGLFPQDTEQMETFKLANPYELRHKALDEQISLFEFGRILLQLSKRKGFKSNRKDNREEGGKLKAGYEKLQQEMQEKGARTYGEYLYLKHLNNPKDNLRLKNMFDESGKFQGGLFPFREVYQQEFDTIWNKQASYYPTALSEKRRKTLRDIIFFQRPLKEAEEGECLFEKGEKRIPKAHPLFQEFRIRQVVLNLKFAAETASEYSTLGGELTPKLINLLMNPTADLKVTKQGTVAYSTLKKALGLDSKGLFNFERMNKSDKEFEKGLLVNKTQYTMTNAQYMKDYWNNFTDEQKGRLINVISRPHCYIEFPKTRLSIEEEDEKILSFLQSKFGLSPKASEELLYDIALEDDFGNLSEKAIAKILTAMRQGLPYTDACQEVGYHHSMRDYTHLDELPYYGEILEQSCLGKKVNYTTPEEQFGKINNATVHVALNQIRHLINNLIRMYGKPFDIAIEYARDLNASAQDRLKMTDTRDKNEAENQRILKEMQDKIGKREYNKRDIQKYKIWKQLGTLKGGNALVKECPFSGTPIALSDLMNGQMFQIEHIIPFSRSLDDSLDNKVIATVAANRYKGNRTPYEAFGKSKDGYDWAAIQRRAKKLSYEQQWRFSKDAMTKFEAQEGPIARSLNDTRYMTRVLQMYLRPIVREDGLKTVQSVVGKLTSMARKSWGLNLYKEKDSDDYRAFHNHHAVDAVVIAAIEREQVNEVAKRLKFVGKSVIEEFKDEFYKFRDSNVSSEEKALLKKRIKDFTLSKEESIINQYLAMPTTMNVKDILTKVENINISHKPNLKDIYNTKATIGKLHEDTAYGLQRFVDDDSLKAVFRCQAEDTVKEVTEYIPMFYRKEDKKAYYDAFRDWFVLDSKSRTMDAVTKEEKAQKQQVADKEKQAIQKLRQTSLKAFKWFVGGGNFCAEIYQINPDNKINGVATKDRGDWKSEIISNYNATIRQRRGENVAYWRYKYPNAKRIMTIRRNDMVMATFSREQAFDDKFPKGIQDYVRDKFTQQPEKETLDVLFRVKKLNSSGTIYFTPHDIAKEIADTKSWIASSGAMQRYQAKKVFISPTGRIYHAQ